ncbi:MAG: hypothetical protein PHD54_02365 [Desulfuromonadaceae bacterium]|nr:hypothetical protein [Desulfuromonadaceae bacterium]
MSTKKYFLAAAVLSVVSSILLKVNFDFCGDYEGVFLLKGQHGAWLEITDDLFPEDIERFITGYALSNFKRVVSNGACSASDSPCMNYEWNSATGRGFIKTSYPDGRKFLICLSRFKDSADKKPSGLILGGNLPPIDPDANYFDRNETGMAYFDGTRYYHIWCNANEGIIDESSRLISPENWKYIDSRVQENSPKDLTLFSRHQAVINNVPITVERTLFYEVGNTYVTLLTKIINVGKTSTAFSYLYGDEPWVGNFGTSAGDIGWLKDRLVTTEMPVDTSHYDHAGIYDYGNILAGEKHVYTNKANFIEWQHENHPDYAFFSNDFAKVGEPEAKTPLASHTNRVIALLWGKLLLQPNQSFMFKMAVGMADVNPRTKMPVKPETGIN